MTNPFAARFKNEPALVSPEHSEIVNAALAHMNNPKLLEVLGNADDDGFWPEEGTYLASLRPYIVRDGILHIQVKGVLLNGFPYQFGSWATGYEYIARAIERGADDAEVRGIALVIDSPGGMVAGNFDLVDRMFMRRADKPIRAFAEGAYSAAYSIASAAERITVTRSGGVGSVGVVTSHVDVSKMLSDIGYKITFIHAGKHKVDGNSYEPLPDDVKARIQARIDDLYTEFVSIVARNRSMEEQAVRDTEALTFTAREAVSNGMADDIGPLEDAMAAFAAELSPNQGVYLMSTDKKDNAAADTQTVAVEAARTEGFKAGEEKGRAEGATAERARINAIIGSDEGKARPAAALSAALKTNMTADEAKGFLASIAEEQPKAEVADNPFAAAMAKGNPELGTAAEEDGSKDPVAAILGDYHAAVGKVAKK